MSFADAVRPYSNDKLAPASDAGFFICGLDTEQAIEKNKQIDTKFGDNILREIKTVHTQHAIIIVSQYPTRHVRIIILIRFNVDCSCVAYEGCQFWAAPRAVAAYIRQNNTVDLPKRSLSYESRAVKAFPPKS